MTRGVNTSPFAYFDVERLLKDIIETRTGRRITFTSPSEADRFKNRCYGYRKLDRARNRADLPDNHPMHGNSECDKLTFVKTADNILEIRFLDNTLQHVALTIEELNI